MPGPLVVPIAIGAYELAVIGGAAITALFFATPQGREITANAVDATVDGVGSLVDAVTPSQSTTDSRTQTQALPITQETTRGCSDCPALVAHIDNLINAARPPGAGGTKGLKQRFCAQKHGSFGPADPRWAGEEIAIQSQQNGVRTTYLRAVRCGCIIPPALHVDVQRYQNARPPQINIPMPGFREYCYGMALSRREG